MSELANLTLADDELGRCKPISSGKSIRAFCPFHGSDRQRSLQVFTDSGRFKCHACGAWGYLETAREDWLRQNRLQPNIRASGLRSSFVQPSKGAALPPPPVEPVRPDLESLMSDFREALPKSAYGWKYLEMRGIPLELAQRFGLGYAEPGRWPQRDWKWGRLVFPHTDPDGRLVSLYGRAVGAPEKVPKPQRHDHLAGNKGYFNAQAIRFGEGPLYVCEGPFDALSLIVAGRERSCAIFGLSGWRWDWARGTRELVFALDADERGQRETRNLAREACLKGKTVRLLPENALGGCKDVGEAWVAGRLSL